MRKSIHMVAFALACATAVLPVSCSRKSRGDADSKSIDIKGSDTMVHLVSAWSEQFMKDNAGLAVTVTGGGSGTGIAALINGTTDICASSREMKDDEIKLAEQKGVKPVETKVALDGIAIVVHPDNPVNDLTMEQVGKMYRGMITNWSQVGGPDQKISLLSRESSSGTYGFFQEHVLNKENFAPVTRLMPASSSIVQSAAEDIGAIGYVGLGYATKAGNSVKILKIKKDPAAAAIAPSENSVRDGSYSISRPLYLYTSGEPQGHIKEFIDFTLSDAGQKIVADQDYVPLD